MSGLVRDSKESGSVLLWKGLIRHAVLWYAVGHARKDRVRRVAFRNGEDGRGSGRKAGLVRNGGHRSGMVRVGGGLGRLVPDWYAVLW